MLNLGIIKKVIIIFWKKQKSVSFILVPFLLSKKNCFINILHVKVKNYDQYVTEWEPLINRHMYIIFKETDCHKRKNPFKTKLRLRIKQKISHLNSTISKTKKKKKRKKKTYPKMAIQ